MILHRTKNLDIRSTLFYCLYFSVGLCVLFQRFIFMQTREGLDIVHNAVKPWNDFEAEMSLEEKWKTTESYCLFC